MKNIKKTIFLLCIVWFSKVYSQISFEHTYITNNKPAFNNSFPNDDGNMDFYVVNGPFLGPNTLDLYNGETHVLYKSMPIPQTYTGTANNYIDYTDPEPPKFFISKHLFNNDDLIEFVSVIKYFNPFGNGVSAPMIVISNELGTILYQIYDRYAPRIVKRADNSYKLLVSVGSNGNNSPIYGSMSLEIDVYSLPGTLSLGQEEVYLGRESFVGYPNPASDNITISNLKPLSEVSDLEVYDMSGKLIKNQTVSAGTINIIVDTRELSTGIYIYKINGVTSGKFIKK